MKQVITMFVAVFLVCSVAHGQTPMPSNYEHLKSYDQLIGTWQYEGPSLEALSGIVEKEDTVAISVTFRWILDKNAVETDWAGEVKKENGFKFSAKGMIGYDTAAGRIVSGELNSIGGYSFLSIVYDEATKTWTEEMKGIDGDGKEVSSKNVITLKDKDTITVQSFDRKGGFTQGDGPVLTLTKAAGPKRTPGSKRPRAAEVKVDKEKD